jgi:hypothetical protein
MEVRD